MIQWCCMEFHATPTHFAIDSFIVRKKNIRRKNDNNNNSTTAMAIWNKIYNKSQQWSNLIFFLYSSILCFISMHVRCVWFLVVFLLLLLAYIFLSFSFSSSTSRAESHDIWKPFVIRVSHKVICSILYLSTVSARSFQAVWLSLVGLWVCNASYVTLSKKKDTKLAVHNRWLTNLKWLFSHNTYRARAKR